jgi:hypothetical protein
MKSRSGCSIRSSKSAAIVIDAFRSSACLCDVVSYEGMRPTNKIAALTDPGFAYDQAFHAVYHNLRRVIEPVRPLNNRQMRSHIAPQNLR